MGFKFTKINFQEFTKFANETFEFSPGINVFIGKNGTGKTHILKVLYAIASVNQLKLISGKDQTFGELLTAKFKGVFNITDLSHLIRRNSPEDFIINYYIGDASSDFYLQYYYQEKKLESAQDKRPNALVDASGSPVYFPIQEIMTVYQDLIKFRNYETQFDDTVFDFAEFFFSKLVPKEKSAFQRKMFSLIQDCLEGVLVKEKDTFYIKYSYGKIEASLLSEGMKKLASLYYLIENGSITENSILFWDEPEIYFNPKLITVLTKILNELAVSGVQVFLATHDYLLTNQLSLLSEYSEVEEGYKKAPINFICLEDTEKEGVKSFTGTDLAQIPNNPILEEFANHYDKERELFERSMK